MTGMQKRTRALLVIAALSTVGTVDAVGASASIRTQWVGASTFGIGFNNPMSAWANASMWQSTTASVAMREPLKNLGYTDAQLDNMSADEMIQALKGGRVRSSAQASPPSTLISPELIRYEANLPPKIKAEVVKSGPLEGLTFPVTTATKYKPVKKRLVTKQLVQALSKDPAVQSAVNAIVEAGLKAYDEEAATDGLQNDVAGSMAFLVGSCDLVINDGVEPDPEGVVLVAKLLQQNLEIPQVKKISSTDKQKMHEYLVGYGSIILASYQVATEAKDANTVQVLKDGCRTFAKTMLHADFSTFKITGFGIEPETP